MTTNDPDDAPTADDLLDRWLADRADEVGLVSAVTTGVDADADDGSFDPDPWSGLELPETELSVEQQEFLGALAGLPELARGADLVDRPTWDFSPGANEPRAGHDPGDPA